MEFKRHPTGEAAFTLIELLITMGVIAIRAAVLLPALTGGKATARVTVCKSNLHQIGIGLRLYVDDFGVYPPDADYIKAQLLPDCGSDLQIFDCPSVPIEYRTDHNPWLYNINGYGTGSASTDEGLGLSRLHGYDYAPVPESHVRVSSDMIAIGDQWNWGWILGFGWPGEPMELDSVRLDRHAQAVFCDGHVEFSNGDSIPKTMDAWGLSFNPDARLAKRWDIDNQPHPETWP